MMGLPPAHWLTALLAAPTSFIRLLRSLRHFTAQFPRLRSECSLSGKTEFGRAFVGLWSARKATRSTENYTNCTKYAEFKNCTQSNKPSFCNFQKFFTTPAKSKHSAPQGRPDPSRRSQSKAGKDTRNHANHNYCNPRGQKPNSPASMLKTLISGALVLAGVVLAVGQEKPAIVFNKSFEGASLGKIEKTGETTFRCHVEGQYDERGRNRQVSWYYFRMEHVQGREVTLTLTDFVGEYNDKPGSVAMNADTIPVFSYEGEQWRHFPAMQWDNEKKEATLKFTPEQDRIWIAHIPPYTHSRLLRLLPELDRSPFARVEVIGKTVQQRDLHLVTVTNFEKPDAGKKTVWLQARQHAWESGTSFVMEGALRFVTSDDARARELRDKVVFKFTPMVDPDGCASGKVRFNANGYDVNRHWEKVDLRRKEFLERMPEIWYVKKAIYGHLDAGGRIDLMVNMHNEESGEHLDTQVDDEAVLKRMQRFYDMLSEQSTFDPSQKLNIKKLPGNTANYLWTERKVPVLLMEQRISRSQKLGRQATVEDRLAFGGQLVRVMAGAVISNQ